MRKSALLLIGLIMSASYSEAQNNDAGIVGVLNNMGESYGVSALDFVVETQSQGALDFVVETKSGSALDFVVDGNAGALDYVLGNGVGSGQEDWTGVLGFINGAYTDGGFYTSGNVNFQQIALAMPGLYSGQITSGFGYRPRFHRVHKGVDFAMPAGDSVRVAMPGVVGRVSYEPRGYGHFVTVKHDNGMETRYAHLSRPLVRIGQAVSAGEVIALSGNTGNSTGPHLHFETRVNGNAVDPMSYFGAENEGNLVANYVTELRKSAPMQDTNMATGFNGAKGSLASKSTYIVRPGDTVKKIAMRAGISPLRLCQLNFITEETSLQPGTMLKLK